MGTGTYPRSYASTACAVVSFEARFTPPSSRRDGQGWGCCYVKGRIWGCGPSAFHGSCGSFHRGRSDGRAHDTLVITRLAARPLGAAARVVLRSEARRVGKGSVRTVRTG